MVMVYIGFGKQKQVRLKQLNSVHMQQNVNLDPQCQSCCVESEIIWILKYF